jgi:hypothetical protein
MTKSSGVGIVEIIVAVGIFIVIAVGAVTAVLQTFSVNRLGDNETDATLYAQEGIEAARSIKNQTWASLTNGNHGATSGGGVWSFSGTSDTKGAYTRQITVADVYRDIPTNNIEISGCANVLDLNAKKVTSAVSWSFTPTRPNSVSFETYYTNWKKTAVGNWASPSQESGVDLTGNDNGMKIQVQGHYAYLVRSTGSPNFAVFDISTTTPTLSSSLTLSGTPTNIYVWGRYAYITNEADGTELQIVDACTPSSPSSVGTFDAAGASNATGVFALGNYAYLVRLSSADNEFVVIDVSTPSSPSLTGSLDLGDDANEVTVIGSNAFIASSSNTQELQVVSVSTPSTPSLIGSLDLAGGGNALTIAGFSSSIILGRQGGELETVSVSTPSAPTSSGTYASGGAVNDVSLGNANNYVFSATNNPVAEFQVVDISTFSTPALFGSVDYTNNINGVAYSSFNDRAYAATEANAQELSGFKPL